MKKTILVVVMFLLFIGTTKAQSGIGIQGGYDWLEGNLALAGQVGNWGGTIGTFRTSMPGSGDAVTGACWSISWNDAEWDESGYYFGIGMNSAGYRQEISVNGGSWGSDIVEPMWIGMVGYRYMTYSGFYLKTAFGYGWCDYGNSFTYGVSAGFMFGN